LQNGKVSADGSYHEIKNDPYLKKVLKATEDTKTEASGKNNLNIKIDPPKMSRKNNYKHDFSEYYSVDEDVNFAKKLNLARNGSY
jgi:hypothetical protein